MKAPRDEAWFADAARAHEHAVRQHLVRRVSPQDADALVDQVFSTAWRARANAPEPLLPGLLAIADATTNSRDTDPAQTDPLVQQLFATLDPAEAELLRLAHWDRLNPREIGTLLGYGTATTRSRLRGAERQARAYLDPDADPDGIDLPAWHSAAVGAKPPTLDSVLAADPASGLAPKPRDDVTAWAVQILTRAAQRPPAPAPAGDQWLVLRSEGEVFFTTSVLSNDPGQWRRIDIITYTSADGRWQCFDARASGELLSGEGDPTSPFESYPVACLERPDPGTALPNTEAELRSWIAFTASLHGGSFDEGAFAVISSSLNSDVIPAGMEVVLHQMLAEMDRIAVIEEAIIPRQVGVPIGLPSAQFDHTFLLMDPHSGEHLGFCFGYGQGPGTNALDAPLSWIHTTRGVVDELPVEIIDLACTAAENGQSQCPEP